MTIKTAVVHDGQQLNISISGRFDFNSVQEFRATYSSGQKFPVYELDLRDVDHIDSSALGMLLNMRKFCGDAADIRISNCKPAIKKIFLISRFDKKFRLE